MPIKKAFTYIDLFAGAGGLSEGFINEGFEPLGHVEKSMEACFSLKTRVAYHHLKNENKLYIYESYLKKEITRKELYAQIDSNLLNTVIHSEMSDDNFNEVCEKINYSKKKKSVDVIIGGPPCQAYSAVGRARQRDEKKKLDDPRRFLYQVYIKFLKKYNPKIFVFENVQGILTTKDKNGELFIEKMKAAFNKAGYEIDYKLLDTTDFGILQKRLRVIIIGWQKKLALSYPDFDTEKVDIKSYLVGRDLLNDLPKLQAGEIYNDTTYAAPPSEYLKKFNIRTEDDILTWHHTRSTNENDKKIFKKTVDTWLEENRRLSYAELPTELKTHKNESSFLNRFCVVKGNECWTNTVVAHIARDGNYYIHPDTTQNRSISVREAARIQSFPDNYYFESSRTSAFEQIGNAVPPLFSKAIATKIKEMLCQIK